MADLGLIAAQVSSNQRREIRGTDCAHGIALNSPGACRLCRDEQRAIEANGNRAQAVGLDPWLRSQPMIVRVGPNVPIRDREADSATERTRRHNLLDVSQDSVA